MMIMVFSAISHCTSCADSIPCFVTLQTIR